MLSFFPFYHTVCPMSIGRNLEFRATANFVNLPQGDAHSLSMMAEDPELRGF